MQMRLTIRRTARRAARIITVSDYSRQDIIRTYGIDPQLITVTPEAAVYAGGRVVYHGRIDDRYVDLGLERPAAQVHDLADALSAVVAGQPVKHPVTQAVGCYIADFK